jgi:uncharacterized membrane protein YozB (DUF420 family)
MKSLSKSDKQGDSILTTLLIIFGSTFMVAITFVSFMSPVWDAFDKWMESSLLHQIWFFCGGAALVFLCAAWIKFRKV